MKATSLFLAGVMAVAIMGCTPEKPTTKDIDALVANMPLDMKVAIWRLRQKYGTEALVKMTGKELMDKVRAEPATEADYTEYARQEEEARRQRTKQ